MQESLELLWTWSSKCVRACERTCRQVTMRSRESELMGCEIWWDSPRRRMAATNSMASATILWGVCPCSFRSRSSSFVRVPATHIYGVRNNKDLLKLFSVNSYASSPQALCCILGPKNSRPF